LFIAMDGLQHALALSIVSAQNGTLKDNAMTLLKPLLISVALLSTVLLVSGCGHKGGNLFTHTLI
jgi:hypothetical protein